MRFIALLLFFVGSAQSFRMFAKQASVRFGFNVLSAAKKEEEVPMFERLAVIGAVDRQKETANTHIFELLHQKKLAKKIWCFSQALSEADEHFAKKRMTNPDTVYTGMLDIMEFLCFYGTTNLLDTEDNRGSNAATAFSILRPNAVIAMNVQPEEVIPYCHMCHFFNISRLVLTVDYSGLEDDLEGAILDQQFVEENGFHYLGINTTTNEYIIGNNTNTVFTIFKVGQMVQGEEGEAAFRIVSNDKHIRVPKPSRGYGNVPLQSGDLDRVVVESLNLPNAERKVFAIGPGTQLDSEVQTYMKSQGWNPRYQVNMLMGPMMNRIRKKIRSVSSNMDEDTDDDDIFNEKVKEYIENRRILTKEAEEKAKAKAKGESEVDVEPAAKVEADEKVDA